MVVTVALALGLGGVAPKAAAEGGPEVTREIVGTSVEGRAITAVRRTTEGAARRVLVLGTMHGDERAGLRVVRRLLDRPHQPPDLDLWLVRSINPDGTADDRRTNANGVDLNRNFPHRWHRSPRGNTWSGPQPLSEPESVALRVLVKRLDPWLVVSFHQPLYGVGANDKGMRTVRALADGMGLPVRDFACTGICHGTFAGWVNHRTDSLAVTVEFGSRVSDRAVRRAAATVVHVGAGPASYRQFP